MRVVIAGSRRLPKGQAPRLLLHLLASLTPDEGEELNTVALRSGLKRMGQFESDVRNLCEVLHLDWGYWKPEPDDDHPGRASVFIRDIEMVDAADLVILFFTPVDAEDGYSGTFHLLDKCLDTGKPVHAYTVDSMGKVARFGDYDPGHEYDHLALDVGGVRRHHL